MNINLGEEISRRRREQKLTQEDLAELSDLSVNFISRLERTKDQNISIQKLDSIARALNTSKILSQKIMLTIRQFSFKKLLMS